MWYKTLMVLPILAALPCFGIQIKQPELDDNDVFDELADGVAEDDDSAGSNHPPLDDYLKLRQKNNEMAAQVEQLASETHELKHRLKVTKLHEKTSRAKIMKKCPTRRGTQRLAAATTEDVKMPWSLTHTATRHKQRKGTWFPGEDTIRGLYNHLKSFSDSLTIENSHRSYVTAGTVGQLHRDVVELHRELKQTHIKLGRSTEVRQNLDEHLQALRTKVAAMEEAAAKDQQKLDMLAADERSLDQQLAELHQNLSPGEGTPPMNVEDREAKVKEEADKLHQEAERRLRESSTEIEKIKKENDQMQAQIEASQEQQPKEESNLQNLQKSIQDGNDAATRLEQQKAQLKQDEDLLKQKADAQKNAVMTSTSKDERCVEWTSKLEAKLKHVLQGKKEDATLCHKSILGLHKERMTWKDGIAKMHSEYKNLKKKAEEMLRKGDETLATLNSCLGRTS